MSKLLEMIKLMVKQYCRKKYDKIVISPGPGNQNQAGNCLKIVGMFTKKYQFLEFA